MSGSKDNIRHSLMALAHGGAGAAGQVSSCQVPTPDLTASTVPESLILECSERTSHKRGVRGLVQMLHLHSELSAFLRCVSSWGR